ncbi:hypothetical protein [Knoellia remsis]|nr:hypothetical protein [Knoellia remsis]
MLTSRLLVAGVSGVFALAVLVYFLTGREDAAVPSTKVDMTWTDPANRVIRADASGAIISSQRGYRGVARSGSVAWDDTAALNRSPVEVVCVGECPNAVLSGDLEDFSPDPKPDRLGRTVALPEPWTKPGTGSNIILGSDGVNSLRLVSDARGAAELQMWRDDSIADRVKFPSPVVGWHSLSADGRSGTLISLSDNAQTSQTLWFASLTADGWKVRDSGAQRACISADGRSWVEDDVLIWKGSRAKLPDSVSGLQCQFGGDTIVFGDRGIQEAGTLTSVNGSGGVLWQRPLPPYSWPTVSVRSDEVAISTATPSGSSTAVVDTSGRIRAVIPETVSAIFTGSGELVTTSPVGRVVWRKI